VADLEKIDTALANINRMIRDNKTALLSEAQKKTALETELSGYSGLDALTETVERLREMDEKVSALAKSARDSLSLFTRIRASEQRLSAFPQVETAAILLETALNRSRESHEAATTAVRIRNVSSNIVSFGKKVSSLPSVDKLISALEKTSESLSRMKEIELHTETCEAAGESIRRKEKAVEDRVRVERELEKRWKEEFPKECPLCGQEVGKS
jgi:hypothetical protein